jgi:uncharacterized membrane protein
MENIFKVLLAIHILCGGISLISGLFVMTNRKGDKRHKLVGKIYFWSLLINSLSAIPMCYIHPNLFLFIVSIFTIYMLVTGFRFLNIRKLEQVKKADYIFMVLMLITGLTFVIWGSLLVIQSKNFGIVLIVFGLLSLNFVRQDYNTYRGRSKYKNFSLVLHIQRMAGSYISSVTAFVVVNNTYLPGVVAWLLPGFIIAPLIWKWSRKHQVLRVSPD